MAKFPNALRILIVDDEDDMCWALRRIIESAGHFSVVATSARQALDILGKQSFHLAFVDVKLPDMEGLDLVQRMHVLSPSLPCILVSGYFYDDDEPVRVALSTKLITGFIGKPFLLTQVHDAIKAAII